LGQNGQTIQKNALEQQTRPVRHKNYQEFKNHCVLLEGDREQANYINALAVSISTIFEPARPTLGELFSPVGELFHDIG
jgi:hypothetical protein